MSERFFSSQPITSKQVTLDGAEAHHLLHVMRAAVGQSVALFDGSGAEFDAVVETLGRSHVDLRVVERHEIDRELPFTLSIGVALPKGDRQKWLVEKLTELGAAALIPLVTERGVAQPTGKAIERLGRTVVESAKQCGRNRLMQITEPQTWNAWIAPNPIFGDGWLGSSRTVAAATGALEPPDIHRLVAHPGGDPLSRIDLSPSRRTQLAIGPEGGLTAAEVAAAIAAGWQLVDLGPRILRVETAAVALSATVALR